MAVSQKPQFLQYLLSCKQLSSEGENIKTTTMRFFQLLLKVANHAALLAPTVRQTLDQQEKVGRRRRTLSGKKNDKYNRTSTNRHLSTTATFFWWTVHTFTLVSTSLQWLLSSVPKMAVVERFNCNRPLDSRTRTTRSTRFSQY